MSPLIYWPPLGHLAVLLALGLVCTLRLAQIPALPDPVAALPDTLSDSSTGGDLFPMPAAGDYEERLSTMDSRPLFVAGRQITGEDVAAPPPGEERSPDAQPSASDLNLRLLAVISRGPTVRALIAEYPEGEEIWVEEGDDVAGWQVVDIAPRALTLHLDDRSLTYKMFE